MNIPDYDKTLCIYCKNKDVCNRKKYKVKVTDNLKYSYCKKYIYEEERNEKNN